MAIQFFFEDVDNHKLSKTSIKTWVKSCILSYKMKVGDINFIYCSDEYLKNINIQYLKHDYYTDIITFNYSDNKTVNGDIYISTDRVLDNSLKYKVEFDVELRRVMIHGILHLLGLNDETSIQKKQMHEAEDVWLTHYA